jgi:hypothetical protein
VSMLSFDGFHKRLRLLSGLVGYPVGFPRFSPVRRKRLLEVWRIRVDA